MEKKFRKILVIRPGALGDTIVALPAVRALRRAAGPGGELEWIGYPRYLSLALNPLHASAVHSVDRALFTGLFSEPAAPDLNRFLSHYDLVVVWCRNGAGHLRRLMRRLSVACIESDPFPADGSDAHAIEHLMQSLAPVITSCGANGLSHPVLVLAREAKATGDELLSSLGLRAGNFLAVHPGSGNLSKNWSPTRFSQVADMARESGLGVLLIEGEADESPVNKMLEHLRQRPPILREEDVQVVARILSHAAVYVGNDSGISHLAAATGVPTIALFGPTNASSWAPRGRLVRLLPLAATAQVVWSTILSVCREPTEGNSWHSLVDSLWG